MKRDDEAVAGIVVAVMMVGLMLAIVSLIQIYYVPKWMKAREAEHLGSVEDQISRLKYALDQQAAEGSAGGRGKDVPISTSITLGSENLGFLVSQRAFGRLNLISQGCSCFFQMAGGANEQYDLTILKYNSENAYYLDQAYVIESGGVVLNQSGSSVFLIKPSISTSYSSRVLTFNWTCINLNPSGGVNSLSGYGTYPIQTKFLGNGSVRFDSVTNISISTYHPEIWKQFFIDVITSTPTNLVGQYLTNGTDFSIPAFEAGDNGKAKMTVNFNTGSSYLCDKVVFNVNLVTISVQFAPGWVE